MCDWKGELFMATSEERLTTLEKTVALLQKSSSTGIQELNRNVTMLLGIASSQQLDIKEIKISLITVEERLDTMSQHIESGFESVGKRMETLEGRFEIQEKKFDQMLHLLTGLTKKSE
jgi:uncharacterized coiled-coil protein SlyX